MAAKTMKPCNCRSWDFGTWTAEVPEGADPNEYYVTYGTGCGESTYKVFAMGHDAKLVGYMVRAELAGEEINQNAGGVRITFPGAVAAAASISGALAAKAQAQLEAARARAAKKAVKALTKKVTTDEVSAAIETVAADHNPLNPGGVSVAALLDAAKADEQEVPVLEPRSARIKVGRWTYDATIAANGVATYRTRLGATHMVDAGAYREL